MDVNKSKIIYVPSVRNEGQIMWAFFVIIVNLL